MSNGVAGQREKRSTGRLSWTRVISGIVLVCSLAYLVFAQGGYYGTSMCFAGLLVWVACVLGEVRPFARVDLASFPVPLLLFALAGWYLVATLVASPTATSALEMGSWFAVAGAALLAWLQSRGARALTLKLIACLGLLTAVLGLAVFSGLLSFDDALYHGRLQSTFQYANAAAVWYGVAGILCFASSWRLRCFSPVCFVAMLLCQSGGATLAFLVVAVVCGLLSRARGANLRKQAGEAKLGDQVGDILFVVSVSLIGSVLMLLVPSAARIVVALLELLSCVLRFAGVLRLPASLTARWTKRLNRKAAMLVLGLAVVLVVLLGIVLFGARIQQAAGTFAMRLVYDMDAISVLVTSPLFGLGPDMWRFLYPQFQSAQYSASLVHCGYLQAVVDAGLPALLLLAGAIVCGVRTMLRDGAARMGELACVLLIAVHSFVDLDLSFGIIALLFGYLLVSPGEKASDGIPDTSGSGKLSSLGFRLALAFFVAVGIAACCWGNNVYSEVEELAQTKAYGCYEQAVQDYSGYRDSRGGSFVTNDPAAQGVYLLSCLDAGSYDRISNFCKEQGVSTSSQALTSFEGLCLAGERELAVDVLVSHLEKEPYNYRFYKKAKRLAHRFKLEGDDLSKFEAAVSVANQAALNQNPLYPKSPKLIKL